MAGNDDISDVVKRMLAERMIRNIENKIMSNFTNNEAPSDAAPPLTSKGLLQVMLECELDADVVISEYAPEKTIDKDGNEQPVGAFVIDRTALPDWEMVKLFARRRGEVPNEKMIIFPGEAKASEALDMLRKRREQ